ncbi:tyrosine-type recombinase/integrase [Pseudomonas sp. NY15437]|uniref:tyrosine-type recombinase/integrase n=1 Tax=Pseudomonas sp. NY15437 TaxID=3400360 RepID=UPI003A8B42F4
MPKQPPKYNPQSNNLVLRGTIWHARMDVPSDARNAFDPPRKVLCKSLRTGDSHEAKKRARHQLSAWWQKIDTFRASRKSTDEWHMEVAGKVANLTELTDKLFADVVLRGDPNPADQLIDLGLDGVREKWLEHPVLNHVYRHIVQAGRYSEDDSIRAPALWLSVETDPVKRLRMLLSVLKETFLDLYPDRTTTEKNQAAFIVEDPTSYKPKSPITKKLQEEFKAHLLLKVKASSVTSYTLKLQTFSEWLTASGKPITFLSVAEFLNATSDNANTRRSYVSALSKFHKWALKYSPQYSSQFSANDKPFAEHEHDDRGDGKGDKWKVFTKEEVEKLHAEAAKNEDTDLADLIMLAAYSGCRISELAKLRVSLVTIADNQPYSFRVEDAKSKAGNREIPIHSALLPMFRKRLAAPYTPNEFLFPGPDRLTGNLRIPVLSERFTKLKKSQGFTDLHCFHSIRKTTTSELLQKGVNPDYIPFIIGHATGKLTFDVYTDGISMDQKVEAISKLSFNFSTNS